MRSPEHKKICWVITGAGHFLRETVELLPTGDRVDVYLTRAALEVAARYGVMDRIDDGTRKIYRETDHSSNPIIYFSMGRYSLLVIAPATSNTVAKCVLGISDSLASNFFAQAGKSGVPALILPTDVEPEATSITPSGKAIKVMPRPIDLEHMTKLSLFPGVSVANSVESLTLSLAEFTKSEDAVR